MLGLMTAAAAGIGCDARDRIRLINSADWPWGVNLVKKWGPFFLSKATRLKIAPSENEKG